MSAPESAQHWHPWVHRVCQSVDVDDDAIDTGQVWEFTGAISRELQRPMAPVSAYIWGLARAQHPSTDPDVLRQAILDAARDTATGPSVTSAESDQFDSRQSAMDQSGRTQIDG